MSNFLIILAEFVFISLIILFLFRIRSRFGLAPLYIFLGTIQYLQTILATTFYVTIFDKYILSPGSIILFSSSIFALLLVYIKEGVESARSLIFGIVLANISLTLLSGIIRLHSISTDAINNPVQLFRDIFNLSDQIFIVGTLTLIIDFFLIIIIYKYLFLKAKSVGIFTGIFFSLLIVLCFDAFVFTTGSYFSTPGYTTILTSQLIGKSIAAFLFSAVLFFYIKYFDSGKQAYFIADQSDDVFSIVNYRKKYEDLKIEKESVEKKLTEKLAKTLTTISDGFVLADDEGNIIEVNHAYEKITGYKREELLNMRIEQLEFGLSQMNIPEKLKVLEDSGSLKFELQQNTKFGEILDLDISISLMKFESKSFFAVFVRDITKRKKVEAVLRESEKRVMELQLKMDAAIRIGQIGFWDWNILRDEFFWSERMYEIFNIEKGTPIKYETVLSRVHPGDKEFHNNLTKKRIKNKDNSPFEYRLQWPDGNVHHVLVHMEVVDNEAGEAIKFRGTVIDVTENKKAEKELSESENRLRAILETEPECIKQIGPNNELIYMNPAGLAMIEAESLEIVKGKPVLGIITEEHRLKFQKLTQEVFEGKSGKLQFEIKGLKGTHRWLETHAVPLRDSEGKIISLIGITLDITESKKTAEIIKESEKKYRSLIEQATDAILIYSFDGVIHTYNKSAWLLSGYSKDEFSKLNLKDLLVGDLVESHEKYQRILLGENVLLNRKLRKKDGKEAEMEINVKMQEDGKVIAFARDVTDRKKAERDLKNSEEKYFSFFEQSADAIFIFDAQGKFSNVNSVAESLLGYSKNDFLKMSIFDILQSDSLKANPIRLDFLNTGEPIINQRIFKKKDGSSVEVEVNSKKMNDGTFHGVVRDITERKKAEQLVQKEKAHSDSIINSLPGIFYLFDANRKFLRWNINFQIITGYTDEELRKINPLNFFENDAKELVQQNFDKTMIEGKAGFEANLVTKQGEKVPHYFTGQRVIYEGAPCMLGTGINISKRIEFEEELQKTTMQLRLLTHHLQNVREEERKIISREIHDELGQQLTVIKMDVAWIDKNTPDVPITIKSKIKSTLSLLDESNLSIKKILSELRADILNNLGLIDTLEWQGHEFSAKTGIPLTFNKNRNTLRVDEPVAICIFRVYQEALTNIIKYANAKKVITTLKVDRDSIIFSIEDDGVGFDQSELKKKNSFGLLGMKERVNSVNGKFELILALGIGTKINLEIPLKVSANI